MAENKKCEHKYVHQSTRKERLRYPRSASRCETFIQEDKYFCEKCLDSKDVKEEWCGQEHYSECPDWVKKGGFKPRDIW